MDKASSRQIRRDGKLVRISSRTGSWHAGGTRGLVGRRPGFTNISTRRSAVGVISVFSENYKEG